MEPQPHKSERQGSLILGIDPGLDTTGYGLLDVHNRQVQIREAGVIRTTPDESLESRIEQVYEGVREIIVMFQPAIMAVEQLHSVYEHPQTAILMGHARGVICLAAAQEAISIASYRPTQIKKTLTGSGRATKEQMQRAIQHEFKLKDPPAPADVADALAVALCHLLVDRATNQIPKISNRFNPLLPTRQPEAEEPGSP
jgi:crossover junction endodeoxyribonuclease RuvC